MGKAKNLKAALQSQQSRLKAKQRISHSEQVASQKIQKSAKQQFSTDLSLSKRRRKAIPVPPPRPPTIPFRPNDKILLIGEGDFSFARALVCDAPDVLRSFPPQNLTATAYDTEQGCYEKYADAQEIVSQLRRKGVEILFGIDGTRLDKTASLKGRRWDRVVWNFPHAGKGITDQDRNILSNQILILGFLRSVAKVLSLGAIPSFTAPKRKKENSDEDEDDEKVGLENDMIENGEGKFIIPEEILQTRGTVLITLRNVVPYTLWDVPRLAKKPPLPTSGNTPLNSRFILLRSFAFHRDVYKGYEHKMTKGIRAHGTGRTGEGGEDRTWEFCLQDSCDE